MFVILLLVLGLREVEINVRLYCVAAKRLRFSQC